MRLQDIQIKDDQIVGFIHSKSLFNVEQPSKLETFVNPIINVKMNTPLKHILEMMKREKCISQEFIMTRFQGNHYFRKYS